MTTSGIRTPLRHSLRFRLVCLVTLVVTVVIALFLWAANRAIVRTLRQAGRDRTFTISSQIATAFAQSGARVWGDLQLLARDPVLLQFLESPSPELRAQVESRLSRLTATGQPPVVLLTASGQRALEARRAAGPSTVALPGASGRPASPGIGLLQVADAVIYSDVVAEIREADSGFDAGGPSVPPRGFLVVRRIFQGGQSGDLVARLVGTGALVAMGNRTGGIWTDFVRQVPAPPVDATRNGSASYRDGDGETRTGGLSVIDGTPWAVWVDLPESLTLAPATLVFRRLVLLALGGILVTVLAVFWIGAHVSAPLRELTEASESVAAGDYSRQVAVDRHDEVGRLAVAFNTMASHVGLARREQEERVERRTAHLDETQALLEDRVQELERTRAELEARAAELASVNDELEAFTYSVSHDLRAPLRHITGFVGLVQHTASPKLDDEERRRLDTIAAASTRMGRLIDDLLGFSRTSRASLTKRHVDLADAVRSARRDLDADPNGGAAAVEWSVTALPEVTADPSMLHLVLVNLLGNAVKYSRPQPAPHVTIGATSDADETVVFVRDNGVGFDMRYADKLFGVFQRLHGSDEFEGTGIGLANVRRIVHRHGGRVWAEGAVGKGATFYFSLPNG